MQKRVKGMSMCNPVPLERDYLIYTAKYAIEHGYTHFEMIGPTHHPVRGNIDGMMYYRKYSQFNATKDKEYVDYCIDLVGEVTEMLSARGIKTYFWHHELEIPYEFDEEYPEVHNADGDVEITHPQIKDFLENKIRDFFHLYPKMDGIVLTLHETRIPLLKLKNQKLDKVERVKYVTGILYDTCRALGKELIVRPFASLEEDYSNMMRAYEQISNELVVCDKWTQFDWSLSLPDNAFYHKIKNNPLMVETDIFGEYFGKGFLPIMLKDHIVKKFAYCEGFNPKGYVSRIDRNGFIPFGTPNEVNLEIMNACHDGLDVDEVIDKFFNSKYGECGKDVRALMEGTEELQVMIFHVNGFDFTELSAFPCLNAIKNCYKIEMMRENYVIDSNEWYIPKGFTRPPIDELLGTKREAVRLAKEKLEGCKALEGRLDADVYKTLYTRFANLYYVSMLFERLITSLVGYAKYFESGEEQYRTMFFEALEGLEAVNEAGKSELGIVSYYPTGIGIRGSLSEDIDIAKVDRVAAFIKDVRASFLYADKMTDELDREGNLDYILAGSGIEGHRLFKEVNFSDTYLFDDGECRIAGTYRGKAFSAVKAHGWFRYEISVRPNSENTIIITAKGTDGHIDFKATVDGEETIVNMEADGKRDIIINYTERSGADRVFLRLDRISEHTPFFYIIRVK